METTTQNPPSEPLLVWTGKIEVHHERSRIWYIATTFALLAILFFAIATQAWSFIVVLLISAVLYFFVHHKPLPTVNVGVFETGIQIGPTIHSWKDCKFFWILVYNKYAELHIRRINVWQPDLYVTVDLEAARVIQTVITDFIPYHEEKNERLLDIITRILKI